MKRKPLITLLMSIGCMVLLITACQKNNNDKLENPSDRSAVANKSDVRLLACPFKDTFVISSGTSFSSYTAWTPVSTSFPAGLSITWEGFSNSFLRPANNSGWYIGTNGDIDNEDCVTWNDIKASIAVKNNNLGSSPSPTYNVVGINGSFGGASFGLGYYSYVQGNPTIDSVVVVWKDPTLTSSSAISTPNGIAATPNAFLIKIKRFGVGAPVGGVYPDTVFYSYRKI
jgi:hypothetical protein